MAYPLYTVYPLMSLNCLYVSKPPETGIIMLTALYPLVFTICIPAKCNRSKLITTEAKPLQKKIILGEYIKHFGKNAANFALPNYKMADSHFE